MAHDTKAAEKAYLRHTAGGAWERFKPFAPPGTDTLDESARLIHDFGVVLQTLRPTPEDRLLDLGAGACWVSDWLERLNLSVVSVDLSLDMLRAGQDRLRRGRGAPLVAGDLESLPFAAGSFTKAVCLNAFHHLPDRTRALAEIRRVLTSDGQVIFSEPGAAHSAMPESVAAMRDFGVLERDVAVSDLMQACLDAGFADVRLQPISFVIPEFNLTLDQWRQWEGFWRRKRPVRAAQKFWRALLEIAGAGKHDLLLEETFAVSLIRLLKRPVEEHPIVVAFRSPYTQWQPPVYRAAIDVLSAPRRARAGEPMLCTVRVTNRGNVVWAAGQAGASKPAAVGVQWLDESGSVRSRDYFRAPLTDAVPPGESAVVTMHVPAPSSAGPCRLKVDLVIEGLSWFEPRGSEVATVHVVVDA
jgi:demethylmenaquinone methyltransferase/2-methoxy-6-polyprenyl-1,4-benzoquinol methylase